MKASPFTRVVTVPKRHETTGEVLRDAEGKPVASDVILGEFTFKCPTLLDEVKIATRIAQMTGGQKLDSMPARAADIAVMLSELPIVVTAAPKDWSWTDLQGDSDFHRLLAVWDAYARGRAEIRGAKPASTASETQE